MKISVIGAAGCIGSSISFNIVKQRLADEVILADISQDWLEHHAIDLFDTTVAGDIDIKVHMGKHEDIANSDIVIMAAGANIKTIPLMNGARMVSRQQLLSADLPIIEEWMQAINQFCPQAIMISATNPAEVINYAAYLLSSTKKRNRFIGYSLNDNVRFKIALAQVLGVATSRIDAIVVGEHGGSMVSLFSSVKLDGKPVTFKEDERVKIREIMNDYLPHMIRLNLPRTSGWVTGVGMANLVRAIVNDTREIIPCCAVLDGEYGYQGTSIGVPVALGRKGISEIIDHKLSSEEKELLDRSVNTIQPSVNYVLEHI